MSKDYSEYKTSKYDEYLKSRTPENGTVLNVFKNRANINIDNQTVEISVDSDNEYFSENFRYLNLGDEFNLYLNTHRDIICEIRKRVLDITDYEKAYEAKQKFNSASGKISFDFADEKQIRNNFYFMNPKVVIPEKINIFSFSRIRLDLFEGILDFIYADFYHH